MCFRSNYILGALPPFPLNIPLGRIGLKKYSFVHNVMGFKARLSNQGWEKIVIELKINKNVFFMLYCIRGIQTKIFSQPINE